jgi:hypothetical protein
MKSEFRATSPEDRGAVTQLMLDVFGMPADHPMLDPRMQHWRYWDKHPLWSGARGYALFKQGEIVAHGAAVPLSWRRGNAVLKAFHLIDWVSKPGAVGAGVAVFRRMAKLADAVLIVGGSDDTRKIVGPLGFKSAGEIKRFARPIRPFRHTSIDSDGALRTIARVARRAVWSLSAASVDVGGWTRRQVSPDELLAAVASGELFGTSVFEHTRPLLSHLLECPLSPMKLYAVEHSGRPQGYFLLSIVPGQARIATSFLNSTNAADWTVLFELAARAALDHPDVSEVVSMTNHPMLVEALRGAAFHARGAQPMNFWFTDRAQTVEEHTAFSMIDSDAAYLHDGRVKLWT